VQELQARRANDGTLDVDLSKGVDLARSQLRAHFTQELGSKLEALGLHVSSQITDNVSMALRVDLAEILLRRARLTMLNVNALPSALTDAELDRELDAREVAHDLDGTVRILKVHALEVALIQEMAPPFGSPTPVEDEKRLRLLFADKIKDELAARKGLYTGDLIVDFEALFSRSDVKNELMLLESMVGSRRLEHGYN